MLPLWNFFLNKRQFSYVLIVTLVVAGFYGVLRIPKENSPSIEIPYGIVVTVLPGASASDTEQLVTNKIEDQIANLENLDTFTSTSGNGVSTIVVQFLANADINQSIQNLRDAVSRAEPDLPTDATTPQVSKINFNDQPVLVASIAGDLPPSEFSALGRTVSDELKNVIGVSRVDVAGVPDREISVIVNKESLDQFGLRLVDIIGAIAASNSPLPSGNISQNGVSYAINFKGGISTAAEIQNIAVSNKNGVPVYLRDIATISDALAPASSYSRVSLGGKPSNQAITLSVYKQSGASIQKVSEDVKARLSEMGSTTLKGFAVLVSPSTDAGAQVGKQLGDLTQTGFETVALVIAALLVTIGWRESLVAALSIPLSFLIAFIGLYFTGNTLNFISLFSLILAVGILVDSGIVVTEAIHARMKIYGNSLDAARAALHDYAWPLMAGTMATVAVFAPLFFISGIIGKFIAGIPYTIIFVLIASIFVALGTVPLIAILFTKKESNRLEKKQEEYTDKTTTWYKSKLRILLENRRYQRLFLRTIGALFVISFIFPIAGVVKAIFFPQEDSDYLYVNIETLPGTTLEKTDLAAREVEEILYKNPDIASFITTSGASSALSGNGSSGANQANVTINLPENRKKSSTQILEDLRQQLAVITDATVSAYEPSNGPPTGSPVQIQFIGSNIDELTLLADRGKQLLSSIPNVVNVSATSQNNGTEFDLTIDRAKASLAGLNTQTVAQTLRAAVNGTKATSITQNGESIDVVVRLNLNPSYTGPGDTAQTTIDSIKNLSIQGQNGPVLLGSILSDSLAASNASIAHKEKEPIQTVSANVNSKTTVSQVISEFQRRIGEINVPAGVTVSYGGETQSINESFTEMFIALLAGLVLMFMILIIAFNSFRYTFYLLMIVPLSLIGVLDGLALTGQPLSFPSLLGFIALGGVIINHAIILMDSLIHYVAAAPEDKPLIDTVIEAAATRLRPIFLTTITTVIGMVPLVRMGGMWGPLAFTVMFGLSFAIVLTLVLVPTIFYRAEQKRRDKQHARSTSAT